MAGLNQAEESRYNILRLYTAMLEQAVILGLPTETSFSVSDLIPTR